MTSARNWLTNRPWVWPFVVALALWVAILILSQGRGGMAVMSAALQFATFFVIVGIGQMLVITAGPGNVDLSIPGIVTFSAFVGLSFMGGTNTGVALGLALGIGVGLATGLINAFLIRILAIPPMIATLAVGFVLHSMASAYSRFTAAKPPPLLADFMASRVFGIPTVAIAFIVVTLIVAEFLRRTTFGRAILAVGQNDRAAYLAGIRVGRTVEAVYVLSGIFASICGILLGVFAGGASLDMGSDFILMSIAVVVLGGTAITGGYAVPIGLWGAATLLQLLVTMLNVIGVPNGIRHAITGAIIIGVLAIGGGRAQGAAR